MAQPPTASLETIHGTTHERTRANGGWPVRRSSGQHRLSKPAQRAYAGPLPRHPFLLLVVRLFDHPPAEGSLTIVPSLLETQPIHTFVDESEYLLDGMEHREDKFPMRFQRNDRGLVLKNPVMDFQKQKTLFNQSAVRTVEVRIS